MENGAEACGSRVEPPGKPVEGLQWPRETMIICHEVVAVGMDSSVYNPKMKLFFISVTSLSFEPLEDDSSLLSLDLFRANISRSLTC